MVAKHKTAKGWALTAVAMQAQEGRREKDEKLTLHTAAQLISRTLMNDTKTSPDGPASGTRTRREGRATSREEVSAPTLNRTAHRQEEGACG